MGAGRCPIDRDILAVMLSSIFRKSTQNMIDLSQVRAVLFDLDGTLVDVDMNRFVPVYLRCLTGYMSAHVDPGLAVKSLHNAVAAMFANRDSSRTLESLLLEVLESELSILPEQYADCLEQFCRNDLEELRPLVKGHPLSSQLVESSCARGWQVVLATNPIFPRTIIDARLDWGKLSNHVFHHVTSYETAHFCKPSALFFEEVVERLQIPAEACLMVGNDSLHDLSAKQVGMQTCLLTTWSIKRPDSRFKADWQGRHEELLALIESAGSMPARESVV